MGPDKDGCAQFVHIHEEVKPRWDTKQETNYWRECPIMHPHLKPISSMNLDMVPCILPVKNLYKLFPMTKSCSPSWELRTASPRGHYGERLQRDSCLKKHMKKHHPLAGDSPWRHYRRDHNIRTAGWIHHQLFRLHWLVCLKKRAFW